MMGNDENVGDALVSNEVCRDDIVLEVGLVSSDWTGTILLLLVSS